MNAKIARDPFFAVVAETWGEAAVFEAGFFEDDDPHDAPLDDVEWLCTPTAAVRRGLEHLAPGQDPVVVLSTGGFWPPHAGHVAMMERARGRLEADGLGVVGGYLSPGHDDYLRLKWGTVAPPAAQRIAELEAHVAGHDWLAVDPWEALHRRTSVNFTDVTARLGAYLRAQVDPRIEVVFVCGADNARFSLAFARRGGCVVVGRPGADAIASTWRHDPRVATSTRVRWVDGDVDAASSSVTPAALESSHRSLRLRLEDERAVRTLGVGAPSWRAFQQALVDRLSHSVRVVAVADAEPGAGAVASPRTITLDPLTRGSVELGVSRLFDLGGTRQLGHVARPGWPPVDAQLAAVPTGEWTLVDDDRATGSTVTYVLERLPPAVSVDAIVLGVDGCPPEGDLADSRDFLLGSDDGGLVLALPDGSVGRAPYLLPYVDPHARCGLAPDDVVAFSRDVWLLGAALFDGTGRRVRDLTPAHAAVLRLAGHRDEALLADVCRAHARGLAERQASTGP